MPLGQIMQSRFDGGIWRETEAQTAPENTAYDIVDGLLDDQGSVYRRGGTTYKSDASAAAAIISLVDLYTEQGQRTVYQSAANVYYLASDTTQTAFVQIPYDPYNNVVRATGLRGMFAFPNASEITIYAGSLHTSAYATGTATFTNGSKTVTGSGTGWVAAGIDAGSIIQWNTGSSGAPLGVVASVDSATQITLRDAWTGGTSSGQAYLTWHKGALSPTAVTFSSGMRLGSVGASPRLLVGSGRKMWFSAAGDVNSFSATDYHEFPPDTKIIGIDSIRDNAYVFTTTGLWEVTNMSYDLTDAYGNVQQSVRQLNPTIQLWHETGLVNVGGQFVVPATDDVFLVDASGAAKPISAAIRPLYRSYVAAGYRPGLAAYFKGHYILPILNASSPPTVQDTLVCRLDGGAPAWTRWSGHAMSPAYYARSAAAVSTPALIGYNGTRVLDFASCFTPSSTVKADANGTNHVLTVITRDFAAHPHLKAFWKKLRVRHQTVDAATDNPTVTAEYATGDIGSSFTALTTVGGTAGAAESDGTVPAVWPVNKRAQSIRFRLKTSGAAQSATIRSLAAFVRPLGRQ